MSALSLAPDLTSDEILDSFRADAFSTLEDGVRDPFQGALPSLIYVEGDAAVYLDNQDTPEALQELEDRDVAIIESLLNLAIDRVVRERRRRNQHPSFGSLTSLG